MLRQALLQFLDEIQEIPTGERTPALESLLVDLRTLRPSLDALASSSVPLTGNERLHFALITDLAPPSTPVWRCSRADCPNKKKNAP